MCDFVKMCIGSKSHKKSPIGKFSKKTCDFYLKKWAIYQCLMHLLFFFQNFELFFQAGTETTTEVAKNSLKRIKTLRHPNIVT